MSFKKNLFNPRTIKIVKRAMETVLPPVDSGSESSEDEIDCFEFLENHQPGAFENVTAEDQTVDQEDIIETFHDVLQDEEIILDEELPLTDEVSQLIRELELAVHLPDEQAKYPNESSMSHNSPIWDNTISPVPSTSTGKPIVDSNCNIVPTPDSQNKKKTRKSPRFSKSVANLSNKPSSKHRKNPIKVKKNYKWSKKQFNKCVTIPEPQFSTPNGILAPLGYFKKMFDDDLGSNIVNYSNLYSAQKTGYSINLNLNEFWDFISILILMGIIKLPNYTDYWSRELNIPIISSKMSLKRFQTIRRYLHFCDNVEYNPATELDKYYKIRPFLTGIRNNFLQIEQETLSSVDEMMIPHKGSKAGSRKQYMPKKPKKWGFKVFVRSGTSGMVYDFIIYGGDSTFFDKNFTAVEEALFGLSGKVVVALSDSIKCIPAAIYCDNFFSSLELMEYLRENRGVLTLGTIRQNRLRNLEIISDKALLKKGRGALEQWSDNKNKLCVVKWADTKCVTLASSFVGAEPLKTIKRYCKDAKTKIDIPCPNVISEYNSKMGGVDLNDMLIALYRVNYKPRKWYMAIFSQFLDIAINNAWLLYRRELKQVNPDEKYQGLKFFRSHLADNLYNVGRKGRRNSSGGMNVKQRKRAVGLPRDESRYDQVGHFSIYGEKWQRCRLCLKGQTDAKCTKCDIYLCHTKKRNCFYNYHLM